MKPRLPFLAAFLSSLLAGAAPAFAAAMRPFAIGGGEGGGGASEGITGWLLNEQSRLTHLMSADLTALSRAPGRCGSVTGWTIRPRWARWPMRAVPKRWTG